MPRLTGFPRVPIPGPRALPTLGAVFRALEYIRDPIRMVERLRPYGDVVAAARGNPALVCVFGAERNREVLSNPDGFRHDETFIDGPENSSLAQMRQTLVNINGEIHKRHRRLMAPAFSRSALNAYAQQTVALTEEEVDGWPHGTMVDLDALVREASLRVALQNLYGVDVHTSASSLSELSTKLITTFSSPLAILLPFDIPGTPFSRLLRTGQQVLDTLAGLVARKRAQTEPGRDALARLIEATQREDDGFSDQELMSEAVTLFIAGYETTAQTLSWTLFLLERHPAVLADVLDELDAVLGGRSMTVDDIPALPLLDRVLEESMRVLTVVPTLFFRVPHDDLPLGRFTMPKGSNVVVSPHATHHDPALWPAPREFRPERWEAAKPTLYEYMPFGAGARACIGAVFAKQTLRLMLPTILQRVRFVVARDAHISRLVRANIMRPRHGIPARLEGSHRQRRAPEPIRGDVHELVALASA